MTVVAYALLTESICQLLFIVSFFCYPLYKMEVEMDNITVYVTALQDSLNKKLDVLGLLLQLTQEQSDVLNQEEPDMDHFDDIMLKKEELLEEMAELDKGFEALFAKVGTELKENKYRYQEQIKQMQNVIRSITDSGIRLEGLEKRNRDAFQNYLTGERKEIRAFKANNKTASSYSQNMANQHREWQSYFMDQKK